MRIGIHTLYLKNPHVGGSKTYTRNLIKALGRIDQDNEYTIFVSPTNLGALGSLPPNFREVATENWKELSIRQTEVDLLHFPGTTIQTRSTNLPVVITVHDLQHLYWPGFFTWRERLRRWRQDRPSIQKANQIIAVSNYTRRTILEKFPSVSTRIQTVHSGVDDAFSGSVSEEAKLQLKEKYNLPATFAFYPARPWPHKNHKRLMDAMEILRGQLNSNCCLVLSGFSAREVPDSWQTKKSIINDSVKVIGYLSQAELQILYQTADLLIFPSLFEGFGLPVLEAMAAGCPVICANASSLPEIAGDAALYIDPFDSAAMAAVIARLLNDVNLRKMLIARGQERASRFSWLATARATLSIYHATLNTRDAIENRKSNK